MASHYVYKNISTYFYVETLNEVLKQSLLNQIIEYIDIT